MDHKRDRNTVTSEQSSSVYLDALYSQAPEEGRSSYGYNLAQCYARVSDSGQDPVPKKKRRSGWSTLTVVGVLMIGLLIAGVFSSSELFYAEQAGAVDDQVPSRELFEDYSAAAAAEEDDGLAIIRATEDGSAALRAEEIYSIACGCTVGVKVQGYAVNVFGQVGSSSINGSGIVLTEDGYILTNYHIIEASFTRGAPLVVITYDGREHSAEIVGVETDSDLAVLKIEDGGDTLIPAQMGDSADIHVGQSIYAVGNALGYLNYTMTSGIISALDRRITTDENVTVNMFQIDAAINNGNSGGPVFNEYGQVIGVVTAKFSLGGMEGLGFAIPINDACAIARDLVQKGYVTGKAYLGLTMATVSPSVARYYNMVEGIYVYALEAGSCAEKAGLTVGDIITAIDGETVRTSSELAQAVKRFRAGDSAELTVYRDESYITVTVVFDEELPAEQNKQRPSREDIFHSAIESIIVREG